MDLITFTLRSPTDQPDRLYGVELSAELEVVALGPITMVPQAPPAIVGVMNLKGHVVALIDLAQLVTQNASMRPKPGDPSLLVQVDGCRMVICVKKILDVHRGAFAADLVEPGQEVISGRVETAAGLVWVVQLEWLVAQVSAQIAAANAHFEGLSSATEEGTRT